MESFTNDINSVVNEINETIKFTDNLFTKIDADFTKILNNYVSKNKGTPLKPSKKKIRARQERNNSHDETISDVSTKTVSSAQLNATAVSSTICQSVNEQRPSCLPPRATRPVISFKEPTLNTKMRRDGENVVTTSKKVTNIKMERDSIATTSEQSKTIQNTIINDEMRDYMRTALVKIEKLSISTYTKSKNTNGNAVEGENAMISEQNDLDDSIEIIQSNDEVITVDDENDDQRMPPPDIVPSKPKEIKKKGGRKPKSSTSSTQTNRSTRSKQPNKIIVKQEPVDIDSDMETESSVDSNSVASSSASTVKDKPSKKAKQTKNLTGESLYEDALCEQPKNVASQNTMKLPLSQQSDATFVTSTDQSECDQLEPRATYIVPKSNCTVTSATAAVTVVSSASVVINDLTVVNAVNRTDSAASIMTEDDSDSSSPSTVPDYKKAAEQILNGGTKKNLKELFNPYTTKTLKQKIAEFEKIGSPIPVRQTRTRTRQNTEPDKSIKPQIPLKPGLSVESIKHARTNSAQRPPVTKHIPMLTKSFSSDEIRKKHQQSVVDEKKRKLDGKLKQAQAIREAKEKEREERLKKAFMEKEQREKEILLKKQREENLKMMENKRKEAEREQYRKEMKANADRKERENQKVLAEQKILQEKLKANQRAAEMRKHEYNFDMIASDDSTDEEDKYPSKRPPPPKWSLARERLPYIIAQSNIPSNTVDNFFSVAPCDVNLRDVFPGIDDKHLKRNSSAIWNTPPRYSMMPKF